MAEVFGIAAGALTVLELTTKVVKQCKTLIETAHDAPRDLRHIFIEISSLKAVLESFDFLSRAEFSDSAQSLTNANGLVEGCRGTVNELSKELDKLSLANTLHTTPGKRQKLKGSVQWCLKESKTRKLLDEAIQHKTTLTLALLGEITTDIKDIKTTVEQVMDNLTQTDRRKICDWIEHTNPTPIHHRSLKNHEEHTCQWIHRVDQWKDWLHVQRRLIWIHGIPGAGKTVLASYLIQQTIAFCEGRAGDRAACLYYYCSFLHGQEERRDEALPFLRWIVSQLCRRNDNIPPHLIHLYQQNHILSFQELEEALQNLLANLDVLYIVVDAIDECNPRDNLLRIIQDILTQPDYAKIQLLVTSRRYMDIEEVLRPLSEPTLPMSNSVVDSDIRIYVETAISRNKYLARWTGKLRKDVAESLVQGAQGMFRWVVCQIDRLQRKSPQQAREAIKCLPRTLEETYETILLEIPEDDWAIARTALQWLIGHSDLYLAFGVPANCLSSAVLSIDHTSMLDSNEDCHQHEFLKVILGCLIELSLVDNDEDYENWSFGGSADGDLEKPCFHTISLAHYTIQEFLLSDRLKTSSVSYFTMSHESCAHKMLETVLQPMTSADYSFLAPHTYHAFERYCYRIVWRCPQFWESVIIQNNTFWHQYYGFFHKNRYLMEDLVDVNEDTRRAFAQFGYEAVNDPTTIKAQYLGFLVLAGSTNMVDKLLEELSLEAAISVSVPLDLYTGSNRSSATNVPGHVTLLDAFGARCDLLSATPYHDLREILTSRMELPKLLLFQLRAHYHEVTCKFSCVIADLLDANVDANSPGSVLTPLQIAIQNWDLSAVELLLEYGADPNGVGQPDGYIPVHFDTTWAQCSPLHIVRNAEYAFMAMEYCLGWKLERARQRPKIEALLLEYGAEDFVRSRPE